MTELFKLPSASVAVSQFQNHGNYITEERLRLHNCTHMLCPAWNDVPSLATIKNSQAEFGKLLSDISLTNQSGVKKEMSSQKKETFRNQIRAPCFEFFQFCRQL